jgi:hypothetical protein
MCFAKKSYRDKFASAANSLPPTTVKPFYTVTG